MRIGISTILLDYGKCFHWLFSGMKKLERVIKKVRLENREKVETQRRLKNSVL